MTNVQPLRVIDENWSKPDFSFVEGARAHVPAFDTSVFGPFWSGLFADAADEQLSHDYFAMTLLCTSAGLIGNARMSAIGSHKQPATLWGINIGFPSQKKSPCFEPFQEIVSNIETDIGSTIKIEDATIASAIRELNQNPHGIMVMNDELSGWWDSFQTDRQGEQFWLKMWNGNAPYTVSRGGLSGGFTVRIERANLSVIGNAQPATLSTMLKATGDVERGFTARCLYAFPNKPVGQVATGNEPDWQTAQDILTRLYTELQPIGYDPVIMPVEKAAAEYHAAWWDEWRSETLWHINETSSEGFWLGKQFGTAMRIALTLECLWWASAGDPDARLLRKAKAILALADPARNDSASEVASARAKFETFCDTNGIDTKTLKGIASPRTVSLKAMKAACSIITDYLWPHFQRCHGHAYQPVHVKAAIDLSTALIRFGTERFNARMLRQYQLGDKKCGSVNKALHGNSATQTVNQVCEYLEEHHVLRRVSTDKTGRKPTDWEVNPLLHAMGKKVLRPSGR